MGAEQVQSIGNKMILLDLILFFLIYNCRIKTIKFVDLNVYCAKFTIACR